MASDQEQKSQHVPYHKRIAMGAPLDGTAMGGSGGPNKSSTSGTTKGVKAEGALAQSRKK